MLRPPVPSSRVAQGLWARWSQRRLAPRGDFSSGGRQAPTRLHSSHSHQLRCEGQLPLCPPRCPGRTARLLTQARRPFENLGCQLHAPHAALCMHRFDCLLSHPPLSCLHTVGCLLPLSDLHLICLRPIHSSGRTKITSSWKPP